MHAKVISKTMMYQAVRIPSNRAILKICKNHILEAAEPGGEADVITAGIQGALKPVMLLTNMARICLCMCSLLKFSTNSLSVASGQPSTTLLRGGSRERSDKWQCIRNEAHWEIKREDRI